MLALGTAGVVLAAFRPTEQLQPDLSISTPNLFVLSQEYAQEAKLKELVTKYSEFTNFPIYLLTEKEVDVPIEDAETKDGERGGVSASTRSSRVVSVFEKAWKHQRCM